jgi:hypothetical protein
MGSSNRVLLCFFALVLLSPSSYGQTFAEFFRQKKTQEEYLLKQIGYLQLYGGYVSQGYEIVGSGLNVIKGFTAGEFDLHKDFFEDFKRVNPLIKKDVRVMEIAVMQGKILTAFVAMTRLELNAEILAEVFLMRQGLMEECEKDIEELLAIMSSSRVEMTDQQRLTRLAKVHARMLEKLAFSLDLYGQLTELMQMRGEEKLNVDWLRRVYENN